MPKRQSDFEFRQQASLSQRVSFEIKILRILAGSDPQISDSIAVLTYIEETKEEEKGINWVIGLLNVLRLSRFATSDKTNEISKMGFMLPVKESIYDGI